ncbi:hypothetical protein [Mucilaginibacter sp. UYCu711]|uniref:DUF6438 domain-containing protein n=1 Tax=Mucilaginibacter sp. UYCu711 TaxID=3156339 RepID=UPI003D1969E3
MVNFLNTLIKKQWPLNRKLTKVNSWQKIDFNTDKNTDLLVEVLDSNYPPTYLIAIDIGYNQFQLIHLGLREGDKIVDIIKDNEVPLIVFSSSSYIYPKGYLPKKKETHLDTLIYKFGGFVELNRDPSHYKIDSITFSSLWGWYGRENTPPKFVEKPDNMIVINHSGKAVLTNNRTNVFYTVAKGQKPPRDPKTTVGVFKGKIKKADLEEIYNLINYISIKKLNDRYTIYVTDLDSSYLCIKFADGSVKLIADYGNQATWGLRSLFSKLYALRGNQNWK